MMAHGIPGTLALVLGVFQFSTRLRQRFLKLRRILGRVPTSLMVSTIQAISCVVTAGTAVHCARTGRIQQHREWMIRSYPFSGGVRGGSRDPGD